jgi:hypothetical protein
MNASSPPYLSFFLKREMTVRTAISETSESNFHTCLKIVLEGCVNFAYRRTSVELAAIINHLHLQE